MDSDTGRGGMQANHDCVDESRPTLSSDAGAPLGSASALPPELPPVFYLVSSSPEALIVKRRCASGAGSSSASCAGHGVAGRRCEADGRSDGSGGGSSGRRSSSMASAGDHSEGKGDAERGVPVKAEIVEQDKGRDAFARGDAESNVALSIASEVAMRCGGAATYLQDSGTPLSFEERLLWAQAALDTDDFCDNGVGATSEDAEATLLRNSAALVQARERTLDAGMKR
eukprot:6754-Pleurochrysis_carterae.AAC.1